MIYFFLAAVFGVCGISSMADPKIEVFLCETLSCRFAGQFWWFLVTPICAYLVFEYFMATHNEES